MDIIQSISTIKNFMGNASRTTCNEYLYEALGEAVQNLEKLLPKKPVFQHRESVVHYDYADGHGESKVERYADWTCPVCGWFVGEQYVPRKHNQQKSNFCSRCGQAIDWSKPEENDA